MFWRKKYLKYLELVREEKLKDYALSIEALKHSQTYSELLSTYTKATKRSVLIRDILKILFFAITIGSLATIVVVFCITLHHSFKLFDSFKSINEISLEGILSTMTIIIPSICSLVVAFIKIPEIIAEYLFNTEEENYMNSIIKNIQDHDKSMFAMEHKINVTLSENKEDLLDNDFTNFDKDNIGSGDTTA